MFSLIRRQIDRVAGHLRSGPGVDPSPAEIGSRPPATADELLLRDQEIDPKLRERLKEIPLSMRVFLKGFLVGVNLSNECPVHYHDPKEPARPWSLAPLGGPFRVRGATEFEAIDNLVATLNEKTLPLLQNVVAHHGLLLIHLSSRRSDAASDYERFHEQLKIRCGIESTGAAEFKIYRTPTQRDRTSPRFVQYFNRTHIVPGAEFGDSALFVNFSSDTLWYLRHFSDTGSDVPIDPLLHRGQILKHGERSTIKNGMAALFDPRTKYREWLDRIIKEGGVLVLVLPPELDQRALMYNELLAAAKNAKCDLSKTRAVLFYYPQPPDNAPTQ